MPLLLQKQIEIKNVQLSDNTEGQQVDSQSPAKASKSKKAKEEKVWLTALYMLYIRLHLLHPVHSKLLSCILAPSPNVHMQKIPGQNHQGPSRCFTPAVYYFCCVGACRSTHHLAYNYTTIGLGTLDVIISLGCCCCCDRLNSLKRCQMCSASFAFLYKS